MSRFDRQSIETGAFSADLAEPDVRRRLSLAVMPEIGAPVEMPALVAPGRSNGPTLLAAAGVIGDVFEGVEAIRSGELAYMIALGTG